MRSPADHNSILTCDFSSDHLWYLPHIFPGISTDISSETFSRISSIFWQNLWDEHLHIYNVLTHIHWHYIYTYIYTHMLIHSVCMYIYNVLIVFASDISYDLWHIFWHFFWHMSSDSFSDTSTGLAPALRSPHLPYGRGRWHGAMRGDDQEEGWNKIWRPSHIVMIDIHDMSEKVSFLAMARWNHPMKFPSERRPRIETSAHAGCLSPHCIFHPRDCLWSEWSPWSAPQVGSATSFFQRFLNIKWVILPTLVVIIHN